MVSVKLTDNQNNLPILDIGNRYGNTDYIDFIKQEEAFDNPQVNMVYGKDKYNRAFYCIRGLVALIKYNGEHETYSFYQTFFQRYTDGKMWMGCGDYSIPLINTIGGMTTNQFDLLSNLLTNKKFTICKDKFSDYNLSCFLSKYKKEDFTHLIISV